MGYQIYANFLLISTAGLPTAIAKQVAKYNVLGKEEVSLYLVREFFKLMLVFGAVFAGVMYLSAPWLADASGSKEKLLPVMYSLVPPLFIFPAMSILRGFPRSARYEALCYQPVCRAAGTGYLDTGSNIYDYEVG